MIEALRTAVHRRAALGAYLDPDGGVIVVGKDRDPSAKVAFILLDRRGNAAAVAKVARRPVSEPSIEAEYATLRQLRSTGSPLVAASSPRPLFLDRIEGRLTLVVSAVNGLPMATRYYRPGHTGDRRRVDQDFEAARTWLRRLHRETTSGTIRLDQALDRWVDSTFRRYREEIGWTRTEAELFHAVNERARALSACVVPMTAVHGDFSVGNLLVDDRGISGVVDWELGGVSGLPFRDVYKFPTSYGFYLDRAYPADVRGIPGHPGREEFRERWRRFGDWPNLIGFGYSYFGRGWFPEQVRQFVLQHLEDLGVPPAVNAVFFPTFLAEQAVTLPDPAFRQGYRSLLRALWEERSSTWLWRRWGENNREGDGEAATEPLGVGER
jgi:aminoglycoside phosphotransferase (APT) family kinase protein